MANPFKLFFVPIVQLFSKIYPQLPRPSTSAEAVDSEVVAPLPAGGNAVDQTEASGNGAKKQAQEAGLALVHHMEWAEIVIGFCLAWAIDIALLSLQVHSQLPAPFHLFSLAILLSFASTVVSKFINPKFLVKPRFSSPLPFLFLFTSNLPVGRLCHFRSCHFNLQLFLSLYKI